MTDSQMLDFKETETDFQQNEQSDENRLIVEAKIPYADLEVLTDLGEGTFGQVKLVYDRKNPENIMAVKVTDLAENKRLVRQCKREALTLRALRGHPNVINYLSMRLNDKLQFQLFMDYVDGGELFDQIEPDVGLSPSRARHFFTQLIEGLIFVHSKGITHRDIKPENLLLTKDDVLKICDFGFATVYRNVYNSNSEETILTEPIGTPEYSAPEVFARHYRGEPVDVWSSGVVLVVMLTGDMPWEEPTKQCPAYYEFAHKGNFTNVPWTRIGTLELSLIRQMLFEDYNKRITLEAVRRHPWVIEDKRTICSPIPGAFDYIESQRTKMASTQPANFKCLSTSSCSQKPTCSLATVANQLPRFGLASASFSQPNNADSLMLSMSQLIGNSQQGVVYHPIQSLVRRMTRFIASANMFQLIDYIEDACSALGCSTQFLGPQQILVTATLRRRHLRYVIKIYEFNEGGQTRQLVDARCSHGSHGIDFKRAFAALRNEMRQHVCKESDNWLRDLGLVPATILIDIATSGQDAPSTANNGCFSAISSVSSTQTF